MANPLGIETEGRTRAQIARDITRAIYATDGIRGFYRSSLTLHIYFVELLRYTQHSRPIFDYLHPNDKKSVVQNVSDTFDCVFQNL